MGESFVDLSYRGLELGRRLRLRDVRADSGYVEIPLPMPVGTRIEIATDEGVRFEANVTWVHEQVGGSDQVPGMRLVPKLAGDAAKWWGARVDASLPPISAAPPAPAPSPAPAPAPAPAATPVTDTPAAAMARPTVTMDPAEIKAALAAAGVDPYDGDRLEDDGKRTEMMQAVDMEALGLSASSSGPVVAPPVEDGKRTTVMDAIDISMITGRATSQIGIAAGPDDEDSEAEISIEADAAEDAEGEGAEVSGEMPATPSGKVDSTGKKKGRAKGGRSKPRKR